MKPLVAVPSGASPEAVAVYAGLRRLAEEIAVEELPGFFAELERAHWAARLRTESSVAAGAVGNGLNPLLTVEQLAEMLQVSTGQVYRMAKGPLRPAAVEIAEGTLRFDPAKLHRFIEARRRG